MGLAFVIALLAVPLLAHGAALHYARGRLVDQVPRSLAMDALKETCTHIRER